MDIKEFFKAKNFDDTTLYYIENFIQEFDAIFGKYLPKEELMKRIENNLNHNFEFVESFEENYLGAYNRLDKKIKILDSMDEEEKKSTIFHEMIHCITAREKYTGFSREYITDLDNVKIVTCSGITEGFTEWLTKCRDENVGYKSSRCSYPLLVEQTQFLIDIVGKDKFIDVGLNRPEKLMESLKESGLEFYAKVHYQDFLENWDIIREYEYSILGNVAKVSQFIFGTQNSDNKAIRFAQKSIIDIFMQRYEKKNISNPSELEEIYQEIVKYAKSMNADMDDYWIYEVLWKKLDDLKENGIANEEILSSLKGKLQEIVKLQFEVSDFLKLDVNEKLEKISKGQDPSLDCNYFEDYYKDVIVEQIFGTNMPNSRYIYEALSVGLAETILTRGYNTNTLTFENIDDEDGLELFFNLYSSTGEKDIYLGTFRIAANYDIILEEFTVLKSQEQRLEFLKQYPELKEDSIILVSPNKQILSYEGDGKYIFLDENEMIHEMTGEMECAPSYAEEILMRINKKIKEREEVASIEGAESLLRSIEKRLKVYMKEYIRISEETTILPEEIDVATKDISIEMIEENVKKLLDSKDKNLTKTFEEGIGYDE